VKPGLRAGRQEVLYVQVTSEMVVEFGGKPLHPFYPMYWACHHAEYVCRFEITASGRKVAHGNMHQVIVPKSRVLEMKRRAAQETVRP